MVIESKCQGTVVSYILNFNTISIEKERCNTIEYQT